MRVSFNTIQGRTFAIGATSYAMVDLPELGPGVYDVVLYDDAEEIDRLASGLTILPMAPAPSIDIKVGGRFLNVPAAKAITPGRKFPPTGDAIAEVIAVQRSIPADVRLRAGNGAAVQDRRAVHVRDT